MKVNNRDLILTSIFISLGILVPMISHFLSVGKVFLPMHYPVLLSAYFLSPGYCMVIGVLTPLLSSILTGMPAFPISYVMMIELASYGLLLSFFNQKRGSRYVNLVVVMSAGRILRVASSYLILLWFGLEVSLSFLFMTVFVTGFPGIVMQLILIPLLVKRIGNREKLISRI